MISDNEIRSQSENAYNQWCVRWREHAKYHSKYQMKLFNDFENIGVGKAVLVIANGRSLQKKIDLIKKHQDNVDIICCDKSLGPLLDNGIEPTYCLVADGKVSAEKYLEPYKDKVNKTILLMNVCANPKWTDMGDWKDRYFFTNQDILKSELEFMKLSGCPNQIPAGTNVSNAMVVLLTQSDNTGRKNFFGYDKIILIGFDYCWKNHEYYAFDDEGDGKNNYQRHLYLLDNNADYVFTSHNLVFSARWIQQYVKTFNLPIINCSEGSILSIGYSKDLEQHLQYKYRREDKQRVKNLSEERNKIVKKLNEVTNNLITIGTDHFWSFQKSI